MTRSALQSILLAAICTLAATSALLAQAPDSVGFQGYLTNSGGDPITQAGVSMTFKLYKNSTAVWTESQSVDVVDGVFHVLLGKISALDTMAFNVPIELGITVGGDPEISPRTPLAAAPYAKALPGLYTQYREDASDRSYNVVGGDPNNVLGSGVTGATISGGGGVESGFAWPNKVLDDYGTVGGGRGNMASGRTSTVARGYRNTAASSVSTVGGGSLNTASGPAASTVAGGATNTADGDYSTISGGISNHATGTAATIGGGATNQTQNYGSTVGGGAENSALSASATVGGGQLNMATGGYSAVSGGFENIASGLGSMVPGGEANRAAGYSFAAGFGAKSGHEGTFVWNDYSSSNVNDSLASSGENQFIIGAEGGVAIGTNEPRAMLTLEGPDDRIMGPSIYLAGTSSNQSESGRIRFVEATGLTNHLGAYIHYEGTGANALHIGTHNTGDTLSANDINIITVERAGGVAIGIEDPGSHQLRVQSSGTTSGGSTLEAKNTSTGAGVAARFEANGTDAAVVTTQNGSGDVMVISTATDRAVEKSNIPNSTRVVGMYATKPGVLLSDLGTDRDLSEKISMAIVGVVPTKVTAENEPIHRGDMLVTSSTSGHAMAADENLVRVGTVIGKALQSFDGPGEGLIEVLVNVK